MTTNLQHSLSADIENTYVKLVMTEQETYSDHARDYGKISLRTGSQTHEMELNSDLIR